MQQTNTLLFLPSADDRSGLMLRRYKLKDIAESLPIYAFICDTVSHPAETAPALTPAPFTAPRKSCLLH